MLFSSLKSQKYLHDKLNISGYGPVHEPSLQVMSQIAVKVCEEFEWYRPIPDLEIHFVHVRHHGNLRYDYVVYMSIMEERKHRTRSFDVQSKHLYDWHPDGFEDDVDKMCQELDRVINVIQQS